MAKDFRVGSPGAGPPQGSQLLAGRQNAADQPGEQSGAGDDAVRQNVFLRAVVHAADRAKPIQDRHAQFSQVAGIRSAAGGGLTHLKTQRRSRLPGKLCQESNGGGALHWGKLEVPLQAHLRLRHSGWLGPRIHKCLVNQLRPLAVDGAHVQIQPRRNSGIEFDGRPSADHGGVYGTPGASPSRFCRARMRWASSTTALMPFSGSTPA